MVKLNGAMLANRTLTQRLYGSEFVKGSQLTILPRGWITATIKFKLENMFFPHRPLAAGESQLSVEWEQSARTRDIRECNAMDGNYVYGYKQMNPTATIQLKSASLSNRQNNTE